MKAIKCFVIVCAAAFSVSFGLGIAIVCMRVGYLMAEKLGAML